MKKFIILFALTFPLLASSQRPDYMENQKRLSAEQRATLYAKKLQLALELSETQTQRLVEIFKKNQSQNHPRKKEERSSETRYKMQLDQLDRQIAIQKEVKTVLNEEQFIAWKKIRQSRSPKMAHKGKRPRAPQPPMHPKGRNPRN